MIMVAAVARFEDERSVLLMGVVVIEGTTRKLGVELNGGLRLGKGGSNVTSSGLKGRIEGYTLENY